MLKAVVMGMVVGVGSLGAIGVEQLSVADEVPMLFMISDFGDEDLVLKEQAGSSLDEVTKRIDRLVSERRVGGVLFKGKWTPTGLATRIQHLRSIAKGPMIFAQDMEWGLSMRHVGVVELPKALTMGAITDDALLETWAEMVAKTAREVGLTCFLGPVADVNSNPTNPVIHDRSFGDDPTAVAHRVSVVVNVLRRHGLLVCLKHWPGHGDTSQDSHTHLPVVNKSWSALEKMELIPFHAGIEAGADCVMSAHICFPNTPAGNVPASLSPFWCKEALRDKCDFRGAVITDDLIMAGALGSETCAQTAVRAVMAGNDLCIVTKDIEECIDAVIRAVELGGLQKAEVDLHVRRVQELQTRNTAPEPPVSFADQVCLHNRLYSKALTLVGEPFQVNPDTTYLLQVGDTVACPLIRELAQRHPQIRVLSWSRKPRQDDVTGLLLEVKGPNEVLVILSDLERSAACSFGITAEVVQGLQKVADSGVRVRYVVFGSPYVLGLLPRPILSALVAYERTCGSEQAVFQALCGLYEPTGILPVRW